MSKLFDKLNRRGVVKVGVAYLAVGWLILQIIDVVGGIIVLPSWLPRFTLFTLLIGLPLVLILSWVYDITPQGIVVTGDERQSSQQKGIVDRNLNLVIIGSLVLVITLLGGRLVLGPGASVDQQPTLTVSNYRQLTRSQIVFPPTPSPYPIVSDSSRLYFNDWGNGLLGLRQLLHTGGEAQRLDLNFEDGVLVNPNTMTPDGANLVVGAFNSGVPKLPDIWHVPVVGGEPRLIGPGNDVNYSADGSRIVYGSNITDLRVANADLSASRKIASVRGKVHWPRFSPDGRTIRFSVETDLRTIWEVDIDNGKPRPLFPEWASVDHCCGSWTQNGKIFVFQATVNYRTQIWAMMQKKDRSEFGQPVRITTGAIDFRRPTISPDGTQIFAVGWQLRGEVVHFVPDLDQFLPLDGFESESAEWIAYSPDSEHVAYITYPESDLWRGNSDGSGKLQLTFPPIVASNPVWSPDQDKIAFYAKVPGEPGQIYLVSPDGGVPTPVGDSIRPQMQPSWSPDGALLAFNEAGSETIRLLEVATGDITDMPGTEKLFMPRWMPDGTRLIAYQRPHLVVYDVNTQQSSVLVENQIIENFEVSRDGRYAHVVTSSVLGPDQSVLRVSIADGSIEKVTGLSNVRIPWGARGMWVGITPDGEPMMLRDLSIHHIYALDWPAGKSID